MNGILNNKNMSRTFILLIYRWNNQAKAIKITYFSVTWLFFDRILYDRKEDNTMNIYSGECVTESMW